VIACAAYLEGEYGYKDLYMGVPIIIGAEGMERVVEIELSADEKKMLETSATAVRELIQAASKL
jgi:malate dehydrogenase